MNEDKEGSASAKGWPQVMGSECKGKGKGCGSEGRWDIAHRGGKVREK